MVPSPRINCVWLFQLCHLLPSGRSNGWKQSCMQMNRHGSSLWAVLPQTDDSGRRGSLDLGYRAFFLFTCGLHPSHGRGEEGQNRLTSLLNGTIRPLQSVKQKMRGSVGFPARPKRNVVALNLIFYSWSAAFVALLPKCLQMFTREQRFTFPTIRIKPQLLGFVLVQQMICLFPTLAMSEFLPSAELLNVIQGKTIQCSGF